MQAYVSSGRFVAVVPENVGGNGFVVKPAVEHVRDGGLGILCAGTLHMPQFKIFHLVGSVLGDRRIGGDGRFQQVWPLRDGRAGAAEKACRYGDR